MGRLSLKVSSDGSPRAMSILTNKRLHFVERKFLSKFHSNVTWQLHVSHRGKKYFDINARQNGMVWSKHEEFIQLKKRKYLKLPRVLGFYFVSETIHGIWVCKSSRYESNRRNLNDKSKTEEKSFFALPSVENLRIVRAVSCTTQRKCVFGIRIRFSQIVKARFRVISGVISNFEATFNYLGLISSELLSPRLQRRLPASCS